MEKKIASNLETKSLKLADKNSKRSETVNNSIERSVKALDKNSKTNEKETQNNGKPSEANKTKVFAIYEPRKMIEPLRKELISRGWVEKSIEDHSQTPSFIWLGRTNQGKVDGCLTNRLWLDASKNFCYKDVLVNYAREVNLSNDKRKLNIPRTYKLFENEKNEFKKDYHLTAYSSLIRFVNSRGSTLFSRTGKINAKWIDYAINNLQAAINCHNFSKADVNDEQLDENDFYRFKQIYQSVVKYESKIKIGVEGSTKQYLSKCKRICEKSEKIWPNFARDGFYNLWLLKPARRSLGFGIKILDDDVDVFYYIKGNEAMKYLVQKYIERPMLIYNTKFDIRQYFLITHHVSSRVRLWMYKMCYLKFSTKLYDPLSYKVCVHITNTAVQCKYVIDKDRSKCIPQCNEWSSEQFLRYLRINEKSDLWESKMYPAMKENIITTVSTSLDSSTLQPNHFQLYGCDFVIDESHEPILLEINGVPILTSVICSKCLADVVKVVIDAKGMPSANANTGHFEMVWEKKL